MGKHLRLIREVFPFHVKTDAQLRIASLGSSATKLLSETCIGTSLMDCMTMVSPRAPLTVEKIERYRNTTLLCRVNNNDVLLRGQLYPLQSEDSIYFLWSPWLDNPEQLVQLQLKETDFSAFDSSIEHMYLMFTRSEQLKELQTANEQLKATLKRTEELASAEAALSRDLEVAADIRLHVRDGALATVQINSSALEGLCAMLPEATPLDQCPDWLHEASGLATDSSATEPLASRITVPIDGVLKSLDLRVSRISPSEFILVGRDITEEQTEHMLLLKTLEQAMEAVVIIDESHRITFFNRAAQTLFQYPVEEALGQHVDLLSQKGMSPRQDASPGSGWMLRDQQQSDRGETTLFRKDGSAMLCSYSISEVSVGRQRILAAFIQDVTLEREAEQRISFQANHDPLTGLVNRRRFLEQLNELLALDGGSDVAVALIDMDNFKTINDLLGHSAGDMFLKSMAQRISDCIRDGDIACRLGGDEFALALAGVSNRAEVEVVVTRLTESLRSPMVIDDVNWEPSASIGIAEGKRRSTSSDLLRNADLAMYEAKALGKGRSHFYSETLTKRATARIEKQKQLERALADGAIEAFFQPIVEMEFGQPKSFEALARWALDDGTMIPPVEFIPIAEASDLIIEIEDRIVMQALTLAKRLRQQYLEQSGISISVNVSARHFSNPRLTPMLQQQLINFDLPGDALTLELTESILLNESNVVQSQFGALRELGVRIALDDFGTGYSSLSYLDRYRFDLIKIDRSFVQDLSAKRVRKRLLEIMIAVGRVMDVDVVAEGIESREDEGSLRDMQCRYGQGYLYAKPMPASQVDLYLLEDVTSGHRLSVNES
ncbi:MAG: EAL domain-containing protein [Pseudomonadota bacterium]